MLQQFQFPNFQFSDLQNFYWLHNFLQKQKQFSSSFQPLKQKTVNLVLGYPTDNSIYHTNSKLTLLHFHLIYRTYIFNHRKTIFFSLFPHYSVFLSPNNNQKQKKKSFGLSELSRNPPKERGETSGDSINDTHGTRKRENLLSFLFPTSRNTIDVARTCCCDWDNIWHFILVTAGNCWSLFWFSGAENSEWVCLCIWGKQGMRRDLSN